MLIVSRDLNESNFAENTGSERKYFGNHRVSSNSQSETGFQSMDNLNLDSHARKINIHIGH